jgi:hypothetical protein
LTGSAQGRPHDKISCGAKAKELGHKYFSIQDGNECYTGNDRYDRFGKAEGDCPLGGGSWKARTWEVRYNSAPVVPPQPTFVPPQPTFVPPQPPVSAPLPPSTSISASPYNNNKIYYLGDIVTKDGIIYKMIDGIGAAGYPPPRPTNWQQIGTAPTFVPPQPPFVPAPQPPFVPAPQPPFVPTPQPPFVPTPAPQPPVVLSKECPAGLEEIGGLCYAPCKSGYKSNGATLCYKEYPDFESNGQGHTLKSITKKITTNTGTPLECGPNQDKIGGLCYTKCRDGYTSDGSNMCYNDLPPGAIPIGTTLYRDACSSGYVPDVSNTSCILAGLDPRIIR